MDALVFTWQNTVVLIALIYGLTIGSVLLIRNRHAKNPHFWLGTLLLSFSCVLVDTYLKTIGLHRLYPAVYWTYYRLLTLIPLTLWCYVSQLVTGRFAIRRFEKILVVCLLVEMVFRLYTFIIGSLGWSAWSAYSFTVLDSVMESLIITVSLVTLYKALVVIRRYRKRLDNNYSEKADKDLKWASELLVVLFIVTCCWMLVVPINFFFGLPISGLWILFPQALLIFYFGIKGHLQPEIFHPFPLIPSFESPKPVPELVRSGVLQNSPQAEGENAPQLALIHRALHEDKVYRKPRLTLQELAKITQINSRQLSMLINQHYQLSFSDFINQHRVEEIKERIRAGEDEKFTLLAIALEAGFNSKSSFNQMFKKFTGKTPMQFKKALTA